MLNPNCSLTDKQKDILRKIAPFLINGQIQSTWVRQESTDTRLYIPGRDKDFPLTLFNQIQSLNRSDFLRMEECGLLKLIQRGKGKQNIKFNVGTLQNAVENDFKPSTPPSSNSGLTVHGNFSADIVNFNTTLNNSTQIIENIPHATEAQKQQLEELYQKLLSELEKIHADHSEQAAKIEKYASRTLEDYAAKDEEDALTNAEKLKQAATKVAAIAPAILTSADAILDFIQ